MTLILLPYLLKLLHNTATDSYRVALFFGCLLFFISWYLPSPLIDGQNTAFTTHFTGGGVFCGFLWLYTMRTMGWRIKNILLEASSLFALVSTLGVANELAEIFFVKAGLVNIPLTDTSWDLLANTLGALTFFIAYKIMSQFSKLRHISR